MFQIILESVSEEGFVWKTKFCWASYAKICVHFLSILYYLWVCQKRGSRSSSTHPTAYSLDLAPAHFFLFPKVNNALAGMHMDDNDVKKAREGVTNTIHGAEWMGAFNS